MQFKSLLLTAFLPLFAAASPIEITPGDTFDAPPAGSVKISGSPQTSGSGCPQGTVSTSLSDDRSTVTFGFDAFQAYFGPDTKQSDRSKNCAIHLTLNYPGGFQYSIMQATYHGYARLDNGVRGTFYSTYFFSQNAAATANTITTIEGSAFRQGAIYTKTDSADVATVVWSPCGAEGLLNINNRIALTSSNSQATGELTDDDATVSFTQQVYVQWRACTRG
ncbi:hypothetical protein K402DRAFT_356318 [Aulographum hederae CBS 113979]|uniref:DUF4360 domain-containing protein n=1 Tax=Aulographum hederae CBS 113979 TaxID=1176131 RepID=A0A6G1GYR5_9PEZI|nr:hypothetical protein K402DRAFT_356318 [Aulographum hederae CBS 113979]